MAKKKKKKLEDDAWMWMNQPFVPGALSVAQPISVPEFPQEQILPSSSFSNAPLWDIIPPPMPGTSFIDNYLLYFFMPSPFEQIGTLLDPLSVQIPPQRYWDNPLNLVFDVYQDVQLMKSTFVPGPYKVHGWPPEGYVEGAGYSTWDPETGTVV